MRMFRVRFQLSAGHFGLLLIPALSTSQAIDHLFAVAGDELTYFSARPA